MLPLDDFVSQTLLGIMSGVQKAIAGASTTGGRVSPEMALGNRTQMVEFDVEVTTATGTGTHAKAGVFVGPVGLGTQGQLDTKNSSVGRVRFKVPVVLPDSDKKGAASVISATVSA